ncbi:MAG TPA: EpsI family protein [Planctomycetota bacterium]|nr:EpsI family protein [Planctomycetota bacterium]
MTRQGYILASVLVLAGILSNTRLYQQISTGVQDTFKQFPQRIAVWQSVKEYPPSAQEVKLLETENIVSRLYRDENKREVMMALVYDPTGNRKMAHPQEICLTAGGMKTVSQGPVKLGDSGVTAQRLVVENSDTRQLYYYWYKAGPHQTGDYLSSQIRLALYSLSGKSAGTALIRLSTTVTAETEAEREKALQDFALVVMPEVDRYLP